MPKKTYFNWSSGKDSALALYKMLQNPNYSIDSLVTTVNSDNNRVSMHGLRKELLQQQTESIGIPLHIINLPGVVSMEAYDRVMKNTMFNLKEQGYTHTVFGDIFLEDLKAYRESKLKEIGIKAEFPLWKKDTKALMEEFIDLGFKAVTVSVNAKLLNESYVGRLIDKDFMNELPENVDACGENGEFHTFVFDGPIFKEPIRFDIGKKVLKSYKPTQGSNCYKDDVNWDTSFWYCDLEL